MNVCVQMNEVLEKKQRRIGYTSAAEQYLSMLHKYSRGDGDMSLAQGQLVYMYSSRLN